MDTITTIKTGMIKNNFFASNKIKILLHLLAWTILLLLPVYFYKRWEVRKDFIWLYYINNLISGLIFYSNYLILVPRYFFKVRRYKYYLSVIVVIALFYFVSDFSNKLVFKYIPGKANTEENLRTYRRQEKPGPPPGVGLLRPPYRQMHFFNFAFNSVFMVFFSLGLKVLEREVRIEESRKEMEKEKLNSELAFLKNQISPHFFFNTLNNIYSLISINADDSQKAVLKLSKLMRYLLYDSEQGNTKLSNEINFMNNYIDLMKLRMTDKISLNVSFPDKYDNVNIPPLLFVPFIENAFKHGISYREKSYIDINMKAAKESLAFRCTNSLFKTQDDKHNDHSGIGLENVTKRLNLLYPGKHELKISTTEKEYSVLLLIDIT